MKSFLESKAMARVLRQSLAARNIDISHSECLELVARQFGLTDWNVLSARIETARAKMEPLPMPSGWFATSFTNPQRFRFGLDQSSPGSALIECIAERSLDLGNERFACMMQSIDADLYRGSRLCLTAQIRCEEAELGTIWMRIDGAERQPLRFDNMLTRPEGGPVSGTVGWTARSVVLDIPKEAASIHYGFLLRGHGRLWARGFRLERVADTVATTEIAAEMQDRRNLPQQPINLDFRPVVR
ncbi:glyoxalase superfamily protein [Rhizobium sp. CF142]|uniref:glyoxalase superfamily protein n=1 Tax=Rhizobium sp. CF142 TaxID=1144314 RepID=UPI00026EED42|nr:glyoxalase superfamily protein [Rhizobium sp. CF142]EJJ29619.1 hypothetical protein PMI11_02100 [Rhizobium sp. CF142]